MHSAPFKTFFYASLWGIILTMLLDTAHAALGAPPSLPTTMDDVAQHEISLVNHDGSILNQLNSTLGGIPSKWHNWHDTIVCKPAFLAFPSSIEEVIQLVKSHACVRVVGLGHSFNDLTCSDDLMMATLQLDRILGLDKSKMTVTTQAGVKTRNLIDWLARREYALPTIPYYIDQSIGGAVATATHGSSIFWGSLSSLVTEIKIVLADGSVRTLTEADGDLFAAARCNVGVLGVVVELTFMIVPNKIVRRGLGYASDAHLLTELKKAEHDSLAFERVHYWYSPPLKMAAVTTVDNLSPLEQHEAKAMASLGREASDWYSRLFADSPLEKPLQRVVLANYLKTPSAKEAATNIMLGHAMNILPGTYKLSDALPVQQVLETDILLSAFGRYDQYEYAVALDKAHDCVKSLFELFDRNVTNRDDFRVPFCLRFVGPNHEGLLGMSRGGSRFYLNMDNYDVYNRHGFSQSMQVIKDLMASDTCQARVHYGKASIYSPVSGAWTKRDAQYVKDTVGVDIFERFLSAAKTLDPSGKFADGVLVPK
jgi:FAD/FMN-containing dehydrogenase